MPRRLEAYPPRSPSLGDRHDRLFFLWHDKETIEDFREGYRTAWTTTFHGAMDPRWANQLDNAYLRKPLKDMTHENRPRSRQRNDVVKCNRTTQTEPVAEPTRRASLDPIGARVPNIGAAPSWDHWRTSARPPSQEGVFELLGEMQQVTAKMANKFENT